MNAEIKNLAEKFKELKAKSEEQSAILKEINAEWDSVEAELISAMAEEGVKTVNLEGLGAFTLRTENYLSVNQENKPSFITYLKESGNGGIVKEDVHPRTLTAFLKTHVEDVTKEFVEAGMDEFDAKEKALERLKAKGAAYFSKKTISFKKG